MASKDIRAYVKSVGGSRTPLKYVKLEFGEVYRDIPELVIVGAAPNQEGTFEFSTQEITRTYVKLAVRRVDANEGWPELSITFTLRSKLGALPPPRPVPIVGTPRHERSLSRELAADSEADAHKRLLLQGDKFLNFSSVRGPVEELQADEADSDSDCEPAPPTSKLSSAGPWECELRCSADLREFHLKQENQVVVLPTVELMNVIAGRKTASFLRYDGARQEAAMELLSLSVVFQSATMDLQIPKGTKHGVRRRFELLNSLTWLKCNVEVQKRAHQAAMNSNPANRARGLTSLASPRPSVIGSGETVDVFGSCDICKHPVTGGHERVLRENGTHAHLRCQKSLGRAVPPPPPPKPVEHIKPPDGTPASRPDTPPLASPSNAPLAASPANAPLATSPSNATPTLTTSTTNDATSPVTPSSPKKHSLPESSLIKAVPHKSPQRKPIEPLRKSSEVASPRRTSTEPIGLPRRTSTEPVGSPQRSLSPASRSASPVMGRSPMHRRELSPLRLDMSELGRTASSPTRVEEEGRVRQAVRSPSIARNDDDSERKRQHEQNELTLLHVRNQISRLQAEVSKQEEQRKEKEQQEREIQEREEKLRKETLASIATLQQSVRDEHFAVRREWEERELTKTTEMAPLELPVTPEPADPHSLQAHLEQVERDRQEINRLFARFRETENSDEEGETRRQEEVSSPPRVESPTPISSPEVNSPVLTAIRTSVRESKEAQPPTRLQKARESIAMPLRSPPARPDALSKSLSTSESTPPELDDEAEAAENVRKMELLDLEKQKLIKQAKDLAEKKRLKKEQREQERRAQEQAEREQEVERQYKLETEQKEKELREWEEMIERARAERSMDKEKEAEIRSMQAKELEEQELNEWELQLASERLDTKAKIARAEMSKRSNTSHQRSGSGPRSPQEMYRSLSLLRFSDRSHSPPVSRSKTEKGSIFRRQSDGDSVGANGISRDLEAMSKGSKRPGFFRRSLVMGKPSGTSEKVVLGTSKSTLNAMAVVNDEPDAIDERLMAELMGVKMGSPTSGVLSNYTPAMRRESSAVNSARLKRRETWTTMKSVGHDDYDDALIDDALTSMEDTHTELWKSLSNSAEQSTPVLAGRLFRVAPGGGETLAYECADGETVLLSFGAIVTVEGKKVYVVPGQGEVLINFSKVAEGKCALNTGDLISFVAKVGFDEKELEDETVPVYKFQADTAMSQMGHPTGLARRSKVSMSMMPAGSNKAAERGLYYVKLLQAGHPIIKYGKSGKPHLCTLTVSHDFTKLIWSDNRSSFVLIRDLLSVEPGRMHPNFARYDKDMLKKLPAGDSSMLTEQGFKAPVSITLEFEKRSLSFELALASATEKDRDRLVAAIVWIKKQEATTIHPTGQVDWSVFDWSVARVFTTFRGPDLELLTRKGIKFLKYGTLTRHTRFKLVEWCVFLFEDILVMATPADETTQKLTIQSVTPLVEVKMDDQTDKAAHLTPELSFTLYLETTNMSVPFICPDAQIRKEWVNALLDAIVSQHEVVSQGKHVPSRHEIFLGTLHSAAYLGQRDKLKVLLAQDPGLIDRKDSQGNTALHICAERGHYKLAKTLLRARALTSIPGARGMTPLWVCCTLCDPMRPRFPELVQLLVGPSISDADLLGPDVPTPLHIAISDVFVQGLPGHRGGLNLLQILSLMWRTEALQALMRALPFEQQLLIDFQHQAGTAPLFLAVRRIAKLSNNDGAMLQRLEFVKKLLQCGAQPNLREDSQLKTALHISGNNGGVQNILVAFGARPDIMDDLDERALSSSKMKITAQHRAAFVSAPPPKPDREVKIDHWDAICLSRKEIQCRMRHRTPHESKVVESDMKEGLVELLGSHLGYLHLLAQVKSEFSSENLLFWKRLQDFKKDPSSTKALELVRGFVVENAPQQVNISSTTRAKIEKAWGNYLLSKDLTTLSNEFELAGIEVMDLMAADSFKRFKGSENFLNFKQGKVPAGFCLICLESASPPVICRRCAVRCCQLCATKSLSRKANRRVTLAGLYNDPLDADISGAPLCDGCHNLLSAL